MLLAAVPQLVSAHCAPATQSTEQVVYPVNPKSSLPPAAGGSSANAVSAPWMPVVGPMARISVGVHVCHVSVVPGSPVQARE
jgi:hypothetical protein